MVVDILPWKDTNLLHKISSLVEKGKVYQEREYQSQRQRRKRLNNGREEKSLKDAGQFLVVKKFYKIKIFLLCCYFVLRCWFIAVLIFLILSNSPAGHSWMLPDLLS